MTFWRRVGLLGVPPPERGAPRVDQLRFVRRLSARFLLGTLPAYALVFAFGVPDWLVGVLLVSLLLSVVNLLSLTRKIRHAS